MDRPTTEIILPNSGATVVLYTYLTTFADREIKNVALKNVKFSGGAVNSDVTGEFLSEAEDVALKHLVKEIRPKEGDVVTEGFLEYIGNLHSEDGDVIYTRINEITSKSKLSPEDKKK